MVRVREKFAINGISVALPDVASDINGYDAVYRSSEAHSKEINDVVSYLKSRYSLPIWIVGTSASAFTVANAAITQGSSIRGAIFSSSLTKLKPDHPLYRKNPSGILNMDLASIKVPVFIAAHKEDGCELTPPEDAELIRKGLISSAKVELKYYTGGNKPLSTPCNALSQHGFYGIEDQVVADMVVFIRAN